MAIYNRRLGIGPYQLWTSMRRRTLFFKPYKIFCVQCIQIRVQRLITGSFVAVYHRRSTSVFNSVIQKVSFGFSTWIARDIVRKNSHGGGVVITLVCASAVHYTVPRPRKIIDFLKSPLLEPNVFSSDGQIVALSASSPVRNQRQEWLWTRNA